MRESPTECVRVRGARQHNLKGISFDLPLNALTVVTGVSGSGKSSLAFDTLYAEGQRRYIESFSTYARQFLERVDKPRADLIDGIPPAIAIDRSHQVRSSRSTIGTMTEINDHLKLLFARLGVLHCRSCGRPVRQETPEIIFDEIISRWAGEEIVICFPVAADLTRREESARSLVELGFFRLYRSGTVLDLTAPGALDGLSGEVSVLVDRVTASPALKSRIVGALEQALHHGSGRATVFAGGAARRFSNRLHCAECDLEYADPDPNIFSFNSPIGACPRCHGFGRLIDVDMDAVVPDATRSLRGGAIRPFNSPAYREGYRDTMDFCRRRGIPVDVPFEKLSREHRNLIIEGEGDFYGIRGFFDWLESKRYKMHIRVLLSRYRAYVTCPACEGRRLKEDGLLYRIAGLTITDIWDLPVSDARRFFENLAVTDENDRAAALLCDEILGRLRYLCEVGLEYLTLGRQSRTLSRGETQRVNLASALGSRLVNSLYVLDEPSVGLHPRDSRRLLDILRGLRERRNTVVVVEHDPEIIRGADAILDLGPGAGAGGGEIVFMGGCAEITACRESLTGRYLSGKLRIAPPRSRRTPDPGAVIRVEKAAEHNLKEIDLDIPLGMMVCVTGVSGSGKSTLVEDIIYRAVRRKLGMGGERHGRCAAVRMPACVRNVIMADQSPVARTPRANAATYAGAYSEIRRIFAGTAEARRRGLGASYFSFNVPGGRCPQCGGDGFEKVEMQFLADVFVRCPECDGARFSREAREITYRGRSVVDVLGMTVGEAMEFFSDAPHVASRLEPLARVGLGYLPLGQPLSTLSGGEAQRLKLARHIAAGSQGGALFIFDEPTTGLHYDDIRVLLAVFEDLIEGGNSLIVVEHNMELVKCADHVIDLGPEGGERGGRIVAQGTPEEVASSPGSITGRFLRECLAGKAPLLRQTASPYRAAEEPAPPAISVRGAREHNLRNINVSIPRDRFIVITGPSGSGKSTLAFDIIYAEGQRLYLESLSAYVRQYLTMPERPLVESLRGLPPTVAVEQRIARGGSRSTVATMTEIYHYLRLMFAKLGIQHCPECGVAIEPQNPERIAASIMRRFRGRSISVLAPVVRGRKGLYRELLAAGEATGYPGVRIDGRLYRYGGHNPPPRSLNRYAEHEIDFLIGSVSVSPARRAEVAGLASRALAVGRGSLYVAARGAKDAVFSSARSCPRCGKGFDELDPRFFSFNSRHGACPACEGLGTREPLPESSTASPCKVCGGARLKPEWLAVTVKGRSIADYHRMSVEEALRRFSRTRFKGREREIGAEIVREIASRLSFLMEVGLPYLALDRGAHTLSGGEAQRVRLAAQLGSRLRGVCYVLDEPTIGIHPRDNALILDTLAKLRDAGNTVLVVEHDEETIRRGDHVIDLGPGGGVHGGDVVAEGRPEEIRRSCRSLTGLWLDMPERRRIQYPKRDLRRAPAVVIKGVTHNNLKRITVRIPMGAFVCVTGVSGAGKSSLVLDTLYPAMRTALGGCGGRAGSHEGIEGASHFDRVMEVDTSPIGRTPRSTAATYVGFWDEIRSIFAMALEARMRGYEKDRFSFNLRKGQCPECKGAGRIKVKMSFLPDVFVRCARCNGRRYSESTLEVRYKGRTISDVLDMTVEEAAGFFNAFPLVRRPLEIMTNIGLGYLTLGQPSATLSGGEAQRVKIAYELARASRGRTLYILDEPTIGLHMADIQKLLAVLQRLVDSGNSVVVIEHNLDLIKEADWIIDLGPEGGPKGGRVVFQGPFDEFLSNGSRSYTAAYLKQQLR